MMELNEEEIPILIGRAWALHERLSCEINKTAPPPGLCRSCRVRGQCVRLSNNKPFHDGEKQKLVGIRDSIGDVGHMLSSLQKLGERHRKCMEEAETGLEERRQRLMELARRHRGTTAVHIITEMEAAFGQRLSKTKDNDCVRRRKLDPRYFLRWMIRILRVRILDPIIEWKRSKWVATCKLIVFCLSISAFVMGRRRRLEGGEDLSRSCVVALDVFHGRG